MSGTHGCQVEEYQLLVRYSELHHDNRGTALAADHQLAEYRVGRAESGCAETSDQELGVGHLRA